MWKQLAKCHHIYRWGHCTCFSRSTFYFHSDYTHRCQPSRSDRESPVFETLSPVHSSLPFFSRFLHRTSRWFLWIWYYSFLISPSVFTDMLWLFDECVNLFCLYNYRALYTTLLSISKFDDTETGFGFLSKLFVRQNMSLCSLLNITS